MNLFPATRATADQVAHVFDPISLTTARQLRGLRKNELAREVGVTPAAISQYELGQARPSAAVLARLALALALPVTFFALGQSQPVTPSAAHFRSLRATTQLQRDQALAFGTVVWRLAVAVERYVELPEIAVPRLSVPAEPTKADIAAAAAQTRKAFGLGSGPVPHVVRLLEAHGVIVLRLPELSRRVDAFSHWYNGRPVVFLNPAKVDKARGRFDAAHEAGHLVMHHDAEPGSRVVENQAHDFAAEFLAPAAELSDELPIRLDWDQLTALKYRWGISLKALVYRAHAVGMFREATYKRALMHLAQHGDPELADLGPREDPLLLEKAVDLCARTGVSFDDLAAQAGLTPDLAQEIYQTCTASRPKVVVGV